MEENQVPNQEQDVTVDDITDEDLFADSIEEETTKSEEPVEKAVEETGGDSEQSEDEGTVKPTEEPKPFALHVKYNGEEKDLGEDEARTLAQKGMNYDKVYEPLQKLAKLNGMEVGEYLNKLSDTQTAYEVDKELSSLKEKYPDTPEEVLNELAQKRVSENQNLQFQRMADEDKGKDDALKAEVQRQVDVFKKEYPNIEPDKLSEEVYGYVKNGYSLLEAYNKWLKVQAEINKPKEEAKEKVEKLNEENKKKSLGDTTNAGNDEPNDFFSGLDSMF